MISTTSIRRLLAGSALPTVAAVALASIAAPGFAQTTASAGTTASDQPASQEIVVTGTLIRNASAASAAPLVQLNSQDLAKRGINTIADAVQSIAANNAGAMTKSWNSFNFATGATAVSLRGLGSGNTLTLFDGLRSAAYPLADDGHRNFVDLNSIPDAIVDHIDVLQDGASSSYGADAVAGVVNVIVKKEIKGLHMNASSGISQRGDAGEQRIDATYGYGDLASDGFNIYVNGEYQKSDPLYARDRSYPFNGADLSGICNSPGSCLTNSVINGVQGNGFLTGIGSTRVPVVRPYDPATGKPIDGGQWQLLNPAAGCRDLTAITLSAAQQADLAGKSSPAAAQQCQQDNVNDYLEEQPKIQRLGGTVHLTANITDNLQGYAMFNYYQVKTDTSIAPLTFAGSTAAGGTIFTINPFFLPVYVCPRGTTAACTAANGSLNPNNPFAAQGQEARVNYRYDRPRITLSDAQTYRAAAGLNGSFGDDWHYGADFTWSRVDLKITNKNFLFAQHLLDVAADGSFNFLDPSANSQAIRDYIAPTNVTNSRSQLWQVQGNIQKGLIDLPGGRLTALVGVAYRKESINNPSANPANEADPADRYYGVNAVGAIGSRNVKSAYFEVDAPFFDMLSANVSGRYDKYSSGQKNFSPKVEAVFKPIQQLHLRGTFSKGFRIPSFNEAYGLPTTGYVNGQIDPTTASGAAFIAAHGGNGYATLPYSYGLTAIGNPNLKPEKSTSYTLGTVFQPTRKFTFTADYWHIKIKDLISNADYSAVVNAYYANNGVVNIPGITVIADPVGDPDHPDALRKIGFIQYSYENANSETASGLDFSGTARLPIGDRVMFTSRADASYLIKLAKNIGGVVQRYDGTLSPCDVTSCSGSPKWRGSWVNTIDFEKASISATVNYTSGYDMASIDYGGVKGDCEASVGNSVATYADGTPFQCHARRWIDVDLSASLRINDRLTLYTNVLNVLNTKPDFNPGQTYGASTGYNYNVAWEGQGFVGRYFRIGAKVDF